MNCMISLSYLFARIRTRQSQGKQQLESIPSTCVVVQPSFLAVDHRRSIIHHCFLVAILTFPYEGLASSYESKERDRLVGERHFYNQLCSKVPIVQARISHLIPYLLGHPGRSLPTQNKSLPIKSRKKSSKLVISSCSCLPNFSWCL